RARSQRSARTLPPRCPNHRRRGPHLRHRRFDRAIVPSRSLCLAEILSGAVSSLSFARLQASGLLPFVQPFVKNDALLVIEKPFLKRCLLLGSICICRWLTLFQNSNEPVFTRRGKIADLAGVQECHGIFDRG